MRPFSISDKWCKLPGSIRVSLARRRSLTAWCSPCPGWIRPAARLPSWWRSEVGFSCRSQSSPLLSYCWRWSRLLCKRPQRTEWVRCSPPRSGAKPALSPAGSRTRPPWRKSLSPCRTQSISDQLSGQSRSSWLQGKETCRKSRNQWAHLFL